MRFTNENNRTRRQRGRKKRRNVIYRFFGLLMLLAMVSCAAVYVFVFQSHEVSLIQPFDKNHTVFGFPKESSSRGAIAPAFADDLCVSSKDVPMEGINVTCAGAGLFDETNKQVLYAKSLQQKLYPASLTKIMTALVALEESNLDEVITVGEECKDIEVGSSVCEIKPGDRLTMRQLLLGLMLNSGNDAAMTIAVHIGGTVDNFVAMMNSRAIELGATNTHFMNPHGLQHEEHHTSIYDVYLMLHEALKYEEFREIFSLKQHYAVFERDGEDFGIMWESTNHYFINEATPPEDIVVLGGKTGTTGEAGACLALYSKNKYGNPFISIIMKADDKNLLYEEMNQLLSKINN